MTAVVQPPPQEVAHPAAGGAGSRARERTGYYLVLLALVVASRAATAVYYVEDTDSLRFALSVGDYDVAELRPHFPGYPVFSFLAKALTALTGSYALAFSLIGAGAVFGIIYHLQRLLRLPPESPLGILLAGLVFFNPLVWLLSNRYMPDLLGVACALAALYHLLHGRRDLGFFLAGLLAGIRLSYLPFVLPPALLALRARTLPGLALGGLGVLVWLIPLVLDTGWGELVEAARRQTEGHFVDFGGTVHTEPELGARAAGVFKGLWAHGLGAYWPQRHPVTLAVAAGMAAALAAGVRPLRRALSGHALTVVVASWGTYLVWIFLYQNVIHKARHVLPLLPLLLLLAALGAERLARRGRAARLLVGLFFTSYAAVTLVLVQQHRRPSAIAQVAEHLRNHRSGELWVVSIPLANFYLSSLGVEARFFSVEDPGALPHPPAGTRVVAVGAEPGWTQQPTSARAFYHNPFVNPMWPEIVLREYGRGGE